MARKLLNASAIDPPKPEFCAPLCDSTKIPYGICPSMCNNLCPPACIPLPSLFQIPPPPPPPVVVIHKTHSLSPALTVSLSLLATAFFLFTCYTVYKFCANWYHPIRRPSLWTEEEGGPDDFLDEEHGPVVDHPIWYIRTIGLQPSVISAITIVKYKRGDGLIEGTDCSVCLSEFEEDETLRLLPKCNHAFHMPCIDTWLRAHTNCPMCRAGIVNDLVAALPSSRELAVHNPGPAEENQPEIAWVDREVGRDSENVSESRLGIEDDGVPCPQGGLKINEDGGGLDGIVPMRRSVSVDSLSASTIRAAIANAFPGQSGTNSDNQLAEVRESMIAEDVVQKAGSNRSLLTLVASPLVEKYLGTAGAGASSSSIKRSVSCSAKVWLSRHSSRSRSFRA